MARVLVIGGTLFIGRALVNQLLARGDEVTVMHRGRGTPFGERVAEIHCDRGDIPAVKKALGGAGFEMIYDNVYDWERGTPAEQVVAAAEAAGPQLQRYVFTSSVAAYGGGTDLDEYDPLAPPDHPSIYGRQKAESERALFALGQSGGPEVTTLRPAFIYGRHNAFDREAWFWDRIRAGRPVIIPEDGSRVSQWVNVDDVARAALAAADNPAAAGRAFNLANYPPVTQVELVETLARAADRPVRLAHIPRERIRAAGGSLTEPPFYFGIFLDLPPLTVRTERVRSELGLELTPLEEGLRETYRWYEQQRRPEPDFSWEEQLIASARPAP